MYFVCNKVACLFVNSYIQPVQYKFKLSFNDTAVYLFKIMLYKVYNIFVFYGSSFLQSTWAYPY